MLFQLCGEGRRGRRRPSRHRGVPRLVAVVVCVEGPSAGLTSTVREGVSLFPPFGLNDGVGIAVSVMPYIG